MQGPGIFIGCAGWSLPRDVQSAFAPDSSHLQRYASRFNGVEINSSFHRPHSRATYERWAEAVPPAFRFSVKLPRTITHDLRLLAADALLDDFFGQIDGLGQRLGCLLVQLPPSLEFQPAPAGGFFAALRQRHAGPVALEPRHASWFTPAVDAWLAQHRVARVLADPVRHEGGRLPGGWPDRIYLRLHGSPRMYYSSYEPQTLQALAKRIALAAAEGREVWCIFDNTAGNAAAQNGLDLRLALDQQLG
ncbi:DUF72 domain-containing protein [Caenimonas terrae]|uniref:DUF72 domain-containing protein n=1 Tax=Caenimonas terrae TaxID=696074 RepID=A0ABW0N8X0_9BURK